jgi:nucleotide-binding universal stress UspA family protein
VLVGVDGSAPSAAALRRAIELGEQLHLPVHAVHAWEYPTLIFDPQVIPPDEVRQEAERLLTTMTAYIFATDGQPPWFTASAERGGAADVLIDGSRGAEMLVVGSRGRGGFAGLLLGSVSSQCAAHAHCPVLIVRPEEAGPSADD